MQLARVIGEVVATIKDPNLAATKLLIVQPLTTSGEPIGRTLVALDSVGAGVGEHVFFVRGREAAFPFYPAEPPTDAMRSLCCRCRSTARMSWTWTSP